MIEKHTLIRPLAVSAIALSIIACSGGSEAPSVTDTGTGAVNLLLTDMPADPDDFLSINATIEMVSLIPDDDDDGDDDDDADGTDDDSGSGDEHVVLYDGPATTIDLLRLRHESIPLNFTDGVPAGEYCKIRLTLSDLQLVLADDTPDDDTDNETFHPKLPGNGKIDIKVRDCLEIEDGDVITLEVDFDAGKSIHIVGNGKGYKFRPVIFVKRLDDDEHQPRLVRLEGELIEFDDDSLLLCDAVPMHDDDDDGCVLVSLTADSAFFDNLSQGGAARPLTELLDDALIGETLTVVGWPQDMKQYRVYVPDGHLPGEDECIIWKIGTPPGLQDEPIDCDEVPDELPDGIVLVTEDGIDDEQPVMELDALAVQAGEFLHLEGEVTTDADSSGFEMSLADGSPISADPALLVSLQEDGIDYNGTRIVSKSGELLESSDVIVPLSIKVSGVLEVLSGSDDMLKAALVIVDMAAMDDDAPISGIVTEVIDGGFIIDPEEDTACGEATDALQVMTTDDTELLTVVITDDDSTIEPGGTIEVDSEVGMNGSCSDDGFDADTVILLLDERTDS